LLAVVERLDDDDGGGVGDGGHIPQEGFADKLEHRGWEPTWKRDCGLDLQGELEKMEMKKSLEFIGSCIPFLFSNGQN
jgi:hypothetical protein